ncbi:MAG: ABC transporter ATP-binding protein [Bacteroidota bacterium]|nr:ABC transporter ATP-binding protein [Bacteroidota bacterium]
MNHLTLTAGSLKKEFNRRVIFDSISFTLHEGEAFAITGRNGSGKSTLVKILCGLLSPTKGTVRVSVEGKEVNAEILFRHLGFVAPYLNMYDEFSGIENLMLFGKIRGLENNFAGDAEELLRQFNIFERRHDEVRTYSSGMKQRLKFAAALLHRPEILVMDEPTSNLDEEGIAAVRSVIAEHRRRGILIIATNEKEDVKYADAVLNLDERKLR